MLFNNINLFLAWKIKNVFVWSLLFHFFFSQITILPNSFGKVLYSNGPNWVLKQLMFNCIDKFLQFLLLIILILKKCFSFGRVDSNYIITYLNTYQWIKPFIIHSVLCLFNFNFLSFKWRFIQKLQNTV